MIEILSLFGDPEFAPAAKPAPKVKKEETKKAVSIDEDRGLVSFIEYVTKLATENDLLSILQLAKCDSFHGQYCQVFISTGTGREFRPKLHKETCRSILELATYHRDMSYSDKKGKVAFVMSFVYASENCHTYVIPVNVQATEYLENGYTTTKLIVDSITVKAAKVLSNIPENPIVLQDRKEVLHIISREKPFVEPWLDEHPDFKVETYIVAPWLETIQKAGYAFSDGFLKRDFLSLRDSERRMLNCLCQIGNSPKEIFKTTSAVMKVLKRETDLATWDVFRRMCKKGVLSDDNVRVAYDRGWRNREFELVNSLLGKKYKGKRVFTWESLTNYIMRVDMYEAIDDKEALALLSDYVTMCLQLNMEPRTDGDSLKREHDIAARLIREKKDPELDERIRLMVEKEKKLADMGDAKLSLCNYSDGKYLIRPAGSYDDLIDEATQQHSCVACYGRRIAEGKTRIFFMREVANPGKSLITVEVDPDLTTIRQKAKECNHSIRDKEQTEFLENWIRKIKAA